MDVIVILRSIRTVELPGYDVLGYIVLPHIAVTAYMCSKTCAQ